MEALLLDTEALLLDTDQRSSRAAREVTRESSSMRAINTTMRELSGSYARSEPIAFFCECLNPYCFSVVWMRADVFDATIAGHTGWMLLEAHRPSAPRQRELYRPRPGRAGRRAESPTQVTELRGRSEHRRSEHSGARDFTNDSREQVRGAR